MTKMILATNHFSTIAYTVSSGKKITEKQTEYLRFNADNSYFTVLLKRVEKV